MDCPVTGKQCESTGCTAMRCSIQNLQNMPVQWNTRPNRNMVIRYSKKFPYAPYLNEDIGFEMTIGEHDNPLEKMEELRQMAHQFHEKNNQPQPVSYTMQEQEFITQNIEPQQVEEKISPEQEVANTISEIENATTETLHTFQLQAAKNVKTLGAFKKRQKQLGIS